MTFVNCVTLRKVIGTWVNERYTNTFSVTGVIVVSMAQLTVVQTTCKIQLIFINITSLFHIILLSDL